MSSVSSPVLSKDKKKKKKSKKSKKQDSSSADSGVKPELPRYNGVLLEDFDDLIVREKNFTPIVESGWVPSKRPLKEYLRYGVINLDKPANPSSHEVVSWVKNILEVEKTGHSGTLDPKVTGNLLVCVDRATRIVKAQQSAGKEYVAVIKFHGAIPSIEKLKWALEKLTGRQYQRPPEMCAVVRQLRVRTIYAASVLEYDDKRNLGVFWVSCQAGTYIRTLCSHLGLLCGVGGHMQELRRVRSGSLDETKNMVTLHDVLDAKFCSKTRSEHQYLRSVVMPLEVLLKEFKKIFIKDTAVDAVCHGAVLMLPGVLRFSKGIDAGDTVVVCTTKGEAVATAIAQMNSAQLKSCTHGSAARVKRVIMERGTYPKRWGLGPKAIQQKSMIESGSLDKYGRPNEKTPSEWRKQYTDTGQEPRATEKEFDPQVPPTRLIPVLGSEGHFSVCEAAKKRGDSSESKEASVEVGKKRGRDPEDVPAADSGKVKKAKKEKKKKKKEKKSKKKSS